MPVEKQYRPYASPQPRAIGYDPVVDLPAHHLAWLVDEVVEATVPAPKRGVGSAGPGQPEYDPRLLVKVLVYGYATGVRSSRRLAQHCMESLPYLLLTRGQHPSYHTLCQARVTHTDQIEAVWVGLFSFAKEAGMRRVGRIVVDSMKLPANVSPEMILNPEEFGPVLEAVRETLARAEAEDAAEEREEALQVRCPARGEREQLRDIVRRVRRQLAGRPGGKPKPVVTERMRGRLEETEEALGEAQREEANRLCASDPEARFMHGGRGKKLQPAYSYEIAVDKGDKLQVAHGISPEGNDNLRLVPLVEAAGGQEPEGVWEADADSGYYRSDQVRELLGRGVDLCVPDTHTAGALHRGDPIGRRGVPIFYEEEGNCYRCPEGKRLVPWRRRVEDRRAGEPVVDYRAESSCRECPRQPECFRRREPKGKYKLVTRRVAGEELREGQARFAEAALQERYRQRGSFVEGVFGYLRGALGYARWLLRGTEKVKCEERLLSLAYQVRQVWGPWATLRSRAGAG